MVWVNQEKNMKGGVTFFHFHQMGNFQKFEKHFAIYATEVKTWNPTKITQIGAL